MGLHLMFTGGHLDRASERRTDAPWLAARLADADSRVLPLWRDLNLIWEGEVAKPVLVDGDAGQRLLAVAEEWGFLGIDGEGRALFAALLAPVAEGEAAGLAAAEGARFQDLSKLAPRLGGADGCLLAYARALMRWHRSHRYCGVCGSPTVAGDGGHLRTCTSAACGERAFPRTDPVVIMLVSSGDRCLLARQRGWVTGLYSTLAGFVEPGEALEDAVTREVYEETAMTALAVRYVASQPWPFPQSLMLGFRVEVAAGSELRFDGRELEDARWFRRDQFASLREHGIRLPYRGTIARALIEGWLAEAAVPRPAADAVGGR